MDGWMSGWMDGWMKPIRIHLIPRKNYIQGLIHLPSVCQVPRPGTSRGDLDRQEFLLSQHFGLVKETDKLGQ